MTCPKCYGCVEECSDVFEEAWWDTVRCLNCGWYAVGRMVTRYTAVRPVETVSRWKPDH